MMIFNSKEEVIKAILEQEPKLKLYAYRFFHTLEDREDLVQETLMRAIHSDTATGFNSINGLIAWLHIIMKNSYINKYRRQSFRNENNYMEIQQTDQAKVESQLMAEDIQRIIEMMPKRLVHVMKLHLLGYKYHEIAKILKCNIGTVKSRLFLGRKHISEKLKEDEAIFYRKGDKGLG